MSRSQPALFRQQAEACDELGSPMYAELLASLADDLEAGGPTTRVLRGHEDDPGPSGLALRLAGSIHRLVLAGEAFELAAAYPTVGGRWSTAGVPAVLDFLARRGDEVRPLLDHAPQTNEVGRAAALVGGLLRLADRWRHPVRLFEIGSSGGLNLQADRFRITDGAGGGWGDPASPVRPRPGLGGRAAPGRPRPRGGRARWLRPPARRRDDRGRPAHAHVVRLAGHDRAARPAGRGDRARPRGAGGRGARRRCVVRRAARGRAGDT